MSKKRYEVKPPLKVSEWSVEQGGGAYIAFEEFASIPGLESADIRMEFKNTNSLEEVKELAQKLKAAGFILVVQK